MSFRHVAPLALAALLSACSDGQGTADIRSDVPCPTNLGEVAAQVFQQSCVDAGCHGSADRAGGLDLGTNALELELFGREAALCGGEVRVVPGDAASSHLIAKLRGTSDCGAQMPVGATLAPETIDCMASWIDGLDVTNTCETCGGAICIDPMTSTDHCGSCGNVCGPGASCADGQCQCGSTTISFASEVQPIFTASCASMGCHDGVGGPGRPGGPSGGATSLDLTMGSAYQSLLETTTPCGPVVAPSDAEASILVGKLTGTNLCMGTQMPKGDGPLTPELIDTIATWICQGAENN